MKRLRRKRKKKTNKGFEVVKNSITKILAIFVIVGLNWTGFSAVIETIAYFNDTENSPENIYQAGTLDFSVTNQNVGGFIGVELGEDKEFISVVTKTSGSLDIQYKARAEKISGNDNFCNALKLEVFHSAISYDGALLSFNTAATTMFGTWAFEVKLPHTATHIPHGEECNVDLVFEGWRDDVADFNQSGFTDEERIHLRLTSRMVVLNEFLPRPDGWAYGFDFGDDSSDMPEGEWVELYNNSDYSADLSGWYIKDKLETDTNKIVITTSNTFPVGTTIGPKSWLVVYMNKAVLDNTGDTVRLFDNNSTLIDSYTYTSHDYCELEPTPGDENSDTTETGSCGKVPPNKSYARIPDGIGGWVDPIPTPGGPNKIDETDFKEEIEEIEPENDLPEISIIDTATPSDQETIVEETIIEENTEGTSIIIDGVFISAQFVDIPTEEESVPELEVEETIEGVEEINEEVSVDESLVVEEQPVIEEQPADVPDNDSGQSGDTGSDLGSGGSDGSGNGAGEDGPPTESPADVISE